MLIGEAVPVLYTLEICTKFGDIMMTSLTCPDNQLFLCNNEFHTRMLSSLDIGRVPYVPYRSLKKIRLLWENGEPKY